MDIESEIAGLRAEKNAVQQEQLERRRVLFVQLDDMATHLGDIGDWIDGYRDARGNDATLAACVLDSLLAGCPAKLRGFAHEIAKAVREEAL